MLKFYFNGSPNPTKIALFLEEAGLPYEPIAVDTRTGAQFTPEFTKLNPNQKVPVIVDGDVTVFDSSAILLYLGEKTGKFMPENTPAQRAKLLSWMMFIGTGIGPYSGQAVHFKHFAKPLQQYPHDRYQYEAERHFGIIENVLKTQPYMLGKTYTIVDMNVWSWARMLPFILGDDAVAKFPSIKRLTDEISARPAAVKAVALKDKFTFKAEMDDAARRNMFKHVKA